MSFALREHMLDTLLTLCVRKCKMLLLPLLYWLQEGGEAMDSFTSFLVSVTAGILVYYLCKWIDSIR